MPEKKDTEALPEILSRTSVPIVADVHFHFKRALEAVEAGVHKIRLNPGNISDRVQVEAVIDAQRPRHSHSHWRQRRLHHRTPRQTSAARELGRFFSEHRHGQMLALMIAKLEEYLDIFHAKDFHDLAIAPKVWTPC